MSRISRYQDSMGRFIKQRSCLTQLSPDIKSKMDILVNECDHVIGILLLTVMNSQGKKMNMTVHGYHIATGIEVMTYSANIMCNKEYYENKLGKECVNEILCRTTSIANTCLSNNIESIQGNYNATNYNKLIKIIHSLTRLMNSKIHKITIDENFSNDLGDNIIKTDIIKYKFADIVKAKNKIKKLKQIKKEKLDEYVQDRYGFICQLAFVNGWLLGGGDDKAIPQMEKLGTYFANILKVVQDFTNIDIDLEHAKNHTKNTIINNGFQNSFELFIENKQKFIEGCIKQGIYTNTVKEIIDLMESKLDSVIDKSSPDMKSHYTLSNE